MLNGVKNNTLWAKWVWDSMQLPSGIYYGTLYHFGNFDQCLAAPVTAPHPRAQYCLVDVHLADKDHPTIGKQDKRYDTEAIPTNTEFRRKHALNTIFVGVCLPESCGAEAVARISRLMLQLSHVQIHDVTVDPRDCQVPGKVVEKSTGFYVFWYTLMAMVAICILVYFFGNTRKKSNSIASEMIRCFCMSRNMDNLLKVYKDEVRVMNGMRCITCGGLIVGHWVLLLATFSVNRLESEREMLNGTLSPLCLHVDLSVDTFFVMSGLLYFRGLMTSTTYEPFRTLLKRYLRLLLPLYLLSIVGITYVLPHIGSGPAWPDMLRRQVEPCEKSWWRNLLMISSKVDDTNGDICLVTSWYLHCDFQLTILSTVVFIVYRKSKRIAFIFCFIVYLLSILIPAVWIYSQKLPALLWYDFGESEYHETNKVYQTIYMPFYTRAGTYLIGVGMGYIMSVYNPNHYRGIISKRMSIVGMAAALGVMVGCLKLGLVMYHLPHGSPAAAMMAATDRSVWALAICAIIIICEYGTMPVISDFLGCRLFVSAGKLCYSIYLFHTILIYRDIYSLRSTVTFDMMRQIIEGLGYCAISLAVCFLLYFFVEMPVSNMISLIFNLNRPIIRTQENKPKKAENGWREIKTEKLS